MTTKQPTDVNQLAKQVVDQLTWPRDHAPKEAADPPEPKGRALSGKARAESLTPQRRREIARKAAQARWNRDQA